MWVQLLKVPYRLLFPAIMAFSCIGIYSVNNSAFEVYLTAIFGIIGFVWMKLEMPPAPMLLGFVLGPLMEENLRRALLISRGDPTVFFTRPISLGFMIATVLIIVVMVLPAVKARSARRSPTSRPEQDAALGSRNGAPQAPFSFQAASGAAIRAAAAARAAVVDRRPLRRLRRLLDDDRVAARRVEAPQVGVQRRAHSPRRPRGAASQVTPGIQRPGRREREHGHSLALARERRGELAQQVALREHERRARRVVRGERSRRARRVAHRPRASATSQRGLDLAPR